MNVRVVEESSKEGAKDEGAYGDDETTESGLILTERGAHDSAKTGAHHDECTESTFKVGQDGIHGISKTSVVVLDFRRVTNLSNSA